MPEAIVPHLLAVVREGLANIVRHADATSARVLVATTDGVLIATIADDGVGLGDRTRSSGLANLEERARLLGGTFTTDCPPEGGTLLVWSVPIRG